MKIKVSEATRLQLDCLVARIEGEHVVFDGEVMRYVAAQFSDEGWYKPTEDWSQGGPIIEREEINLIRTDSDDYEVPPWAAEKGVQRRDRWYEAGYVYYQFVSTLTYGPTPLIAAMRCFVASRMGDEVEVPEALCM